MKGTKAAIRYAKSLLDLSMENGNIDSVAGDMKFFADTHAENRDLALLLSSPLIDATKKVEVFTAIFGQFEKQTMSFFELVTKNGRENLLPEIAKAFDAELKSIKGIVPVEIVSAVRLDEETKKMILAKLESSVTGTFQVSETINPDLIGGFIVKMGDKQIDASVASQLNNLKQRLTH